VAISATLLLGLALLVCIELSMMSARGRLERENRLTIYISPAVPTSAESKLSDRIVQSLGAHAESSVTSKWVASSETLGFLKSEHPELYAEIRDLGSEGDALVPRVVHATASFEPSALSSAVTMLRDIPGVESVETTESRAAALAPAVRGLQWLLRVLALGVASAWVLGWVALARAHSASLAGVIKPLRLWGAGVWAARAPGILAGAWVGLPSGVLAGAGYFLLARPVLQRIAGSSALFESTAIPGMSGVVALILTSLLAGVAAGALSGSAEA
jgi:cell division protein FtsX